METNTPARAAGGADLTLGVRRRRWVLAVLALLMLSATITSLIMVFWTAPNVDGTADREARRRVAVDAVSALMDQRDRLVTTWFLTGDEGARAELVAVDQQLDTAIGRARAILPQSARPALEEVTAAL